MRPSEAFRFLPRRVRVKALRKLPAATLRDFRDTAEEMRTLALEREPETVPLLDAWLADVKAAMLGSIRA